jgi:hypothetical protein
VALQHSKSIASVAKIINVDGVICNNMNAMKLSDHIKEITTKPNVNREGKLRLVKFKLS